MKKITQLRSGDIWVASSGRGLFCIPQNTKVAVRITDVPETADYSLMELFTKIKKGMFGLEWIMSGYCCY